MNKALFLDRDGVINYDTGYTYLWSSNIVMPNVINLVKKFKANDYLVFVMTNQSGIGRGYFTEAEFKEFMKHLFNLFSKKNAHLDGYYYCSCDPTQTLCNNRKPNPGMFFSASKEHNINLSKSVMIGDKISDMIAAEKASIKKKFLYDPLYKKSYINDKNINFTTVQNLTEINVGIA